MVTGAIGARAVGTGATVTGAIGARPPPPPLRNLLSTTLGVLGADLVLFSIPASHTPSVTLAFGAADGVGAAMQPGSEDGVTPGRPLAGRDAGRLGSEGVEGVGAGRAAGRCAALGLCRRATLPD